MKEIRLSRGLAAFIDDVDFDRVNAISWYASRARHGFYAAHKYRSILYMHRFILNAEQGIEVDHINGNGLDNRRSNLRTCTISQNAIHSLRRASGGSHLRGVWFDKRDPNRPRPWQSVIMVQGRRRYLGCFDNPVDAAKAYDATALSLAGPFAVLNFPAEEK